MSGIRTTTDYEPGFGTYVSFYITPHEGMTILLDKDMTAAAIKRHVAEVVEWLES